MRILVKNLSWKKEYSALNMITLVPLRYQVSMICRNLTSQESATLWYLLGWINPSSPIGCVESSMEPNCLWVLRVRRTQYSTQQKLTGAHLNVCCAELGGSLDRQVAAAVNHHTRRRGSYQTALILTLMIWTLNQICLKKMLIVLFLRNQLRIPQRMLLRIAMYIVMLSLHPAP